MNDNLSQQLNVHYQPVENLTANPRNARTHPKRQIRQIAESIRAFGFSNPVLVDRTNTIIAGHGRVEAAKLLGIGTIPTIRLEFLTEDQIRAFVLADNKIALEAGWDGPILAIELQHLLTIEESFDVRITGFQVPEIDLILEEVKTATDKDDSFEISNEGAAVSRSGDLWTLGRHRILCGNSLEEPSYKTLMVGRKAQVVLTDPPYNVKIDGHASGNGAIHHRPFQMATGEMSEPQFIAFLSTIFSHLKRHSKAGSLHYIFMDWRHARELLAAGNRNYDDFINVCIWIKSNAGLGSFYRSQHELVFVFRAGKSQHQNNIQLGRYGRNRTNVWQYPCVNSLSRNSEEGSLLALHPTVKPVQLLADAILDCTTRGDVVLDPFLGSGSTLLAAERVARTCLAIEIDPIYVDTAIRRWQSLTGDRAIHSASRKAFDDLSSEAENDRQG